MDIILLIGRNLGLLVSGLGLCNALQEHLGMLGQSERDLFCEEINTAELQQFTLEGIPAGHLVKSHTQSTATLYEAM